VLMFSTVNLGPHSKVKYELNVDDGVRAADLSTGASTWTRSARRDRAFDTGPVMTRSR
jgi:hypothetical protein